jgi:DNA polymerase elongation subunit (family B)
MNQEQFIDLFLNNHYIVSGYATLYEDQENSINIGSAALKFLLDSRKVYKTKMENSKHGSDEYVYYRILQLTYKVLANSYYGIIGQTSSVFFNPHVQNSITTTGQDLIMTSITTLESFLANNLKFKDFDDIVRYIEEITSEKIESQIMMYLDEPIINNELLNDLISRTEKLSDENKKILGKIIEKLSVEDANRIYYKNRILKFVENSYIKNKLENLIKDFNNEKMTEFRNLIIDFCFINSLYEDRENRVISLERKNVVVTDTDSAFVNVSNYLSHNTKLLNLDSNNKEQQNTILNIYIDIVTKALDKTFWKMTGNMGIPDKYKPIISMKQEFLYKRLMLTRNKKSKQHCSFKIFLIAGNPLELLEPQRNS